MKKLFTLLSILIGLNYNSFAIKVERTVFPKEVFEGTSTIVSLTISKEGEEGFAKLMETIPAGFEVEELNSSTGNFIFEDGKLRIIWLTMPEGESFKAEYKLIHKDAAVASHKIDGKFYYVKDGKRSEYKISPSFVKILEVKESKPPKPVVPIAVGPSENEEVKEEVKEEAKEEVAEVEEKIEEVKEEVAEEVAVEEPKEVVEETKEVVEEVKEEVKEEVVVEEVKEEPVVEEVKEEPVVEEVKEVASSDLVFKVQVGVFSTEKSSSVFGDLPDVHYEMAGKYFKYYSGRFSSEYEARSVIEKAKKSGFPGAFLVKFKDGKRI